MTASSASDDDQKQSKKRKHQHESDEVIDKNEAIKNAIEAAKRIKAKLDNKVKEEEEEEDKRGDNTDSTSSDSNNECDSSTNNNTDDNTRLISKTIDISNSKHTAFLISAPFPSLLLDRLQLAPQEQFTIQISDKSVLLSASSEDIIELAEKELTAVLETGHFRSLKPTATLNTSSKSQSLITKRILLGFEPLPTHISFLRGKLLGPQGSFLKHIQSTTRTRVQLRGKGSGYFEVHKARSEEQEAMHLVVEGADANDVKEAKQLCEDLVATARAEYEAKIAPRPSPAFYPQYPNYPQYAQYPPTQLQTPPPFYPPQTPQQYYAMQQAYAQYYAAHLSHQPHNDNDKDVEKK